MKASSLKHHDLSFVFSKKDNDCHVSYREKHEMSLDGGKRRMRCVMMSCEPFVKCQPKFKLFVKHMLDIGQPFTKDKQIVLPAFF